MATYKKKLLDANGNVILPYTRSNLIYMSDNCTLEDRISVLSDKVKDLEDKLALLKNGLLTGTIIPEKAWKSSGISVLDKNTNAYESLPGNWTFNIRNGKSMKNLIYIWDPIDNKHLGILHREFSDYT